MIGAAQRVEHYEIAAYGTAKALAEILGENDHVATLEETLNEETETDVRLTELAGEINNEANSEDEEEEPETPPVKSARKKEAAQ